MKKFLNQKIILAKKKLKMKVKYKINRNLLKISSKKKIERVFNLIIMN